MLGAIYEEAQRGKPILAEGGGLMYLVSAIEGYSVVGIFKGQSTMTSKLQRFGYVNITLEEDTILGPRGTLIPGKEYHRSVVESQEKPVFNVTKPKSSRSWLDGYQYKHTLAYYQHINFLGNMDSFYDLLDNVEKIKKRGS